MFEQRLFSCPLHLSSLRRRGQKHHGATALFYQGRCPGTFPSTPQQTLFEDSINHKTKNTSHICFVTIKKDPCIRTLSPLSTRWQSTRVSRNGKQTGRKKKRYQQKHWSATNETLVLSLLLATKNRGVSHGPIVCFSKFSMRTSTPPIDNNAVTTDCHCIRPFITPRIIVCSEARMQDMCHEQLPQTNTRSIPGLLADSVPQRERRVNSQSLW